MIVYTLYLICEFLWRTFFGGSHFLLSLHSFSSWSLHFVCRSHFNPDTGKTWQRLNLESSRQGEACCRDRLLLTQQSADSCSSFQGGTITPWLLEICEHDIVCIAAGQRTHHQSSQTAALCSNCERGVCNATVQWRGVRGLNVLAQHGPQDKHFHWECKSVNCLNEIRSQITISFTCLSLQAKNCCVIAMNVKKKSSFLCLIFAKLQRELWADMGKQRNYSEKLHV